MKNPFKRLLKPQPRRVEMVVAFTFTPDGQVHQTVKIANGVPVATLIAVLERVKNDVQHRLTIKCQSQGYNYKNPKTRAYIAKQTIGDLP